MLTQRRGTERFRVFGRIVRSFESHVFPEIKYRPSDLLAIGKYLNSSSHVDQRLPKPVAEEFALALGLPAHPTIMSTSEHWSAAKVSCTVRLLWRVLRGYVFQPNILSMADVPAVPSRLCLGTTPTHRLYGTFAPLLLPWLYWLPTMVLFRRAGPSLRSQCF